MLKSFVICGDGSAMLYLSKGKVCIVDEPDLILVRLFSWHAAKNRRTWYAAAKFNGRTVTMHSYLMGQEGMIVHHKDGDGLNNRRSNLELMTRGAHTIEHKCRVANSLIEAATKPHVC